jgi:threonine dehydratase
LSQEHGSVLINPLDNLEMILGAASLGLELLEQEPETEAIVVPIGGGALIAGVAAGVKALKPDVLVYGVQPEGACAVYRSIEAGSLVELATVETIADGLAVKRPSASTVAAIERLVDQIVLVSDDEIRRAMYLLLERSKLLVEPSGAASLAGVLSGRLASIRDRRTVVVLTGGNADFGLLARVVGSPTTDGDGL